MSDPDLLLAWENSLDSSLIEKSLLLLAITYPDMSPEKIASFSIGERDARLLLLREKLFGTTMLNTGYCPACAQKIEWEVSLDQLKLQQIGLNAEAHEFEISYKDYQIVARLPNSTDIMQISSFDDESTAVTSLVRRCITQSNLPEAVMMHPPGEFIDVISSKFSEQDPQADIRMNLQCPECQHQWDRVFDIMQYIWFEIHERVRRIFYEITVLAQHFGWTEPEILALSPMRRQTYLMMIQS